MCSLPLRLSFGRIFKNIRYDASGPEVVCVIIQNQKQVNSFAVFALVQAIHKMRLVDEPGQDVKVIGNKMDEMDRRICGTRSTPIDLYTLVTTAFIECKVLAFQQKATYLHGLFDRKPKTLHVDKIIRTLKTKLRFLKAQGMWSPIEIDKLDKEIDLC